MTHIVLAFMAVLLGAASLAIILLYRVWKKTRDEVQDLQAQVAAQQIAALTGMNPPGPGGDLPAPEPVRRKRHLALYLGGGVAAVYATCRDGLRALARERPRALIAAAATVATVGTAAALVLAPTGGSSSNEPGPPQASTKTPNAGTTGSLSPGQAPDADTDDTGPRSEVWAEAAPGLRPVESGPLQDTETPAPDTSTSPAATPGGDTQHGGARPSGVPPENRPDTPATNQPPADRPQPSTPPAVQPQPSTPPTSKPQPSTPPPGAGDPEPPTGKEPKEDDGGLCVKVPPLLDLCLLAGA